MTWSTGSPWPPSPTGDRTCASFVSSVGGVPVRRASVVWAFVVAHVVAAGFVGSHAAAAPLDRDDVVAFLVEGTGNGHGRGLSQWGAYGWAVDHGWTWEEILDHYYGGTVSGKIDVDQRIRVRLTDWDGAGWFGFVSASGQASWSSPDGANGSSPGSVRVVESSDGLFDVAVAAEVACPGTSTLTVPDGPIAEDDQDGDAIRRIQTFLTAFGHDPKGIDGEFGPLTASAVRAFQVAEDLTVNGIWDADDAARARELIASSVSDAGWTTVAEGVAGPITVSSDVDESAASPGEVLGVCSSSGAVTHYRGRLDVVDTTGGNRLVNDLRVEDYLRGVVPREVSASWGDRGDGDGMNALMAQAVAARSYGVAQSRFSYAGTCDTSSCQVYAGAAVRATPGATSVSPVERPQTDTAIDETEGVVRLWAEGNLLDNQVGTVASTEFSASNGPQTAGGAFPSVTDTGDAVSLNPNHRWTRVLPISTVLTKYKDAEPDRVTTVVDPDSVYEGIYANCVRLRATDDENCEAESEDYVSAWALRNDFGLPSPGFTLTPVRREVLTDLSLFFVGDSVGESITRAQYGSELPTLIDGSLSSTGYDALSSRRTEGGSIEPDGVGAAASVPIGTDLVVVELGYNDEASAMPDRIDAVMETLVARGVGTVLWVTMSERRMSGEVPRYALANEALRDARGRWPQLIVIDWNEASSSEASDRWYSDDVHLTTTGQAEFALWLREEILSIADPGWVSIGSLEHHVPITPTRILDTRNAIGTSSRTKVIDSNIEVDVLGEGGVPGTDVDAVALNLTVVDGSADIYGGFATVYPCGAIPDTSNINFSGGQTIANTLFAPVSDRGTVCVYVRGAAHVLLDVSGYFPAGTGFRTFRPERILDTRKGLGFEQGVVSDDVVVFTVLGRGNVPESGVAAVTMNLTVTETTIGEFAGFATAYPCGEIPDISHINFEEGETVANAVTVPVSEEGTVCVRVFGGAHLLADVSGYFPVAAGFVPITPLRLSDTRRTEVVGALDGTAGPLEVRVVTSPTVGEQRVVAASLNITAVDTETNEYGGFVTVYPCGTRPDSSNLNFASGMTVANGVTVPISRDGRVCLYVYGQTDLLVDLNGLITS